MARVARLAGSGAFGVLCAANIASFFLLPSTVLGMVGQGRGVAHDVASEFSTGDATVPPQMRQFDLRRSDEHWEEVTEVLESFRPERSVVIAFTTSEGSFRHLGYYLPEYRVFAVGFDRTGRFGLLFEAEGRETTYTVEGLGSMVRTLRLPEEVDTVLIPDPAVYRYLDVDDGVREIEVADGTAIVEVSVEPGSVVTFVGDREERAIRVRDAVTAGDDA